MTLRRVVVLAFLFVTCRGSERTGYPGYELFPDIKGWLKLHVEPTTYKSARASCHSEAALLVSPWSSDFEPAVRKLLSTRFHTIPKVFSGAGLRKDSPGIPVEPCTNKRCRVFLASGGMDKVQCDDHLPYVCFAPQPQTMCGSGYEFKSEMGECYKLHTDGASLPDARSFCTREGAFLAYISSSVEQKVLESMSDGITFIENGSGAGPDYRHLSRSGYTDYNCDGPHSFICEMVTPSPAALAAAATKDSGLID